MKQTRREVSTEYIVATARKILAKYNNDSVTIEQIAKESGCGVVRARNALESHGYEFGLNVGVRLDGGMSAKLPISEWTIDWSKGQGE